MSVPRTILLCSLALILAVVLLAGQLMILAQQTILKTDFLLPHVERLFSAISAPQTHEDIVRYLVGEVIRGSRVRGVSADMRERLMKASVTALSPQWIQEEVLDILNKTLAVLRGRSQKLEHTIYLSRRKDVLVSELSRDLPADTAEDVRAGSGMIPDSVELTVLIGKEVPATLRLLGQRYILFSLLFIYVFPGAILLLILQVGRVRWGIVGVGAAALTSGLVALLCLILAYPAGRAKILSLVSGGLPAALSWAPGFIRDLLSGIQAAGRSVSVGFMGAGAALLVGGIIVVLSTRKKAA